jgi:hypothetical protein
MPCTDENREDRHRRAIEQAEVAASALTVACGLVVATSPWFVRYTDDFARWNAIVTGGAVALLALVRSTRVQGSPLLSHATALLGGWVFVFSFWLQGLGGARAISGIFGFLICGFSLLSAAHGDHDRAGSSPR